MIRWKRRKMKMNSCIKCTITVIKMQRISASIIRESKSM